MSSVYDDYMAHLIHTTGNRLRGLQARREWVEALAARYPLMSSFTVQDDGEVWLAINCDDLTVASVIAAFEHDGFAVIPTGYTTPGRLVTRLQGTLGVVSLYERVQP